MIIAIDTTKDIAKVALFESKNNSIIDQMVFSDRQNLSEKLLEAIDSLLKKNKINKTELNQILVNPGPGSYTSIRIGVVTAESLAFGLNIPIGEVSNLSAEAVKKSAKKTSNKQIGATILPIYAASPVITDKSRRKS
jgi:tRNA threonylcarbamoyladenosine biosynthesis protein TsaB